MSTLLLFGPACAGYNAQGTYLGYLLALENIELTSSECGIAPEDITLQSITSSTSSISVAWENPMHCLPLTAVVRRSLTARPTDIQSGAGIASLTTGFTDASVAAGSIYYYTVFLLDSSQKVSAGVSFTTITGAATFVASAVSTGAITIDGFPLESIWNSVASLDYAFAEAYGESGGLDLPGPNGYLRFAYDSTYLYFLVQRNDRFIRKDSTSLLADDTFVIRIDTAFDRSTEVETDDIRLRLTAESGTGEFFRGDGTNWAAWTPATLVWQAGLSGTLNDDTDTDTEWFLEGRVERAELGMPADLTGASLGVSMRVCEDDGVNPNTHHGYELTDDANSEKPSTWGVLAL